MTPRAGGRLRCFWDDRTYFSALRLSISSESTDVGDSIVIYSELVHRLAVSMETLEQ